MHRVSAIVIVLATVACTFACAQAPAEETSAAAAEEKPHWSCGADKSVVMPMPAGAEARALESALQQLPPELQARAKAAAAGDSSEGEIAVHHFLQVFPDTSLGRGGLAGQALSGAYTTVVVLPRRAFVLRGGRLEYIANRADARTKALLARDITGHCVAGYVQRARYQLLPAAAGGVR